MSKKTIRLYGDMGKKFGRVFKLEVSNPAEAIHALRITVPGFDAYLREHMTDAFRVLVGSDDRGEEDLSAPMGQNEVIKIVPIITGSTNSILGRIVLGAALVYLTWGAASGAAGWWGAAGSVGAGLAGAVGAIGWSMVLGGVAQMLANTPASVGSGLSGNNDKETWSFGSPTLTTGQGGAVPLGYGTMRIGGAVISAGIDAHTWQDKGFGGAAPDNAGTQGGDGDTSPWVWAIAP
jgi:predicted phage tail protein